MVILVPKNQRTNRVTRGKGQVGGVGDLPKKIRFDKEIIRKPPSFLAAWIYIESGSEARTTGPQERPAQMVLWFLGRV